jgi:integrase/recombinase XerD
MNIRNSASQVLGESCAAVSFRLTTVITPDGHVRYVVVDDGGSIVQPIADYLRYLDDTGKARNTLRVYGLGLAHYFAYVSEKDLDYPLVGVRARAGFVAWLKRPKLVSHLEPGRSVSQARSNATINLYLTAVSGFYDYLFRTEQISKNPNDQLAGPHRNRPYKGFLHHAAPKVVATNILAQAVARRKRPTTMSRDQVEQLRAACESKRDRALVRLIFETGLRPGEVLALWLEDVNIGELQIDVRDRGELPNLAEIKRPASERTLDVTQDLMNDLLAYVSEAHTEAVETNHVFLVSHGPRRGQPLRYAGLYAIFRRLEKRAGLSITPYVLRHTSLTILAEDGWSPERLQVRAGHKHFQTTMDHYVHPSRVRMRQAWEASTAAMTLNAAQGQR